jgi:hypothetical protein
MPQQTTPETGQSSRCAGFIEWPSTSFNNPGWQGVSHPTRGWILQHINVRGFVDNEVLVIVMQYYIWLFKIVHYGLFVKMTLSMQRCHPIST